MVNFNAHYAAGRDYANEAGFVYMQRKSATIVIALRQSQAKFKLIITRSNHGA